MAGPRELAMQAKVMESERRRVKSRGSLDADIIIANAPDPVFVSDLEGKILQANDAVSQLLGFRQDEVLEQSLARQVRDVLEDDWRVGPDDRNRRHRGR